MLNESIIKTFVDVGECEIYIDKVIAGWDKKISSISKYHDQYTLFEPNPDDDSTAFKIVITKSQAFELIGKLRLKEVKSTTFKHASTFRSTSNR